MDRFEHRVSRTVDRISQFTGQVAGWMVIIMVLLTLIEVVSRYVFNSPLLVADEFGGYLLVAVSYIGLAYTINTGGHVRLTSLIDRLPRRVSKRLRLLTLLMLLAFIVILIQASIKYVSFSFDIGQHSSSWLQVPLQIPQLALPLGFLLSGIVVVGNIFKLFLEFRGPREGTSVDCDNRDNRGQR